MDYKKKLKTRLYLAFAYIFLGILMILSAFVVKIDHDFLSSFGLAMILLGLVRIRNYRLITKNEDAIRKQQIIETDERNISIIHKAKSTAFTIYTLLAGTAVIVLSLFGKHETARWIAYSICLLVIIYWICYWVYQKKG